MRESMGGVWKLASISYLGEVWRGSLAVGFSADGGDAFPRDSRLECGVVECAEKTRLPVVVLKTLISDVPSPRRGYPARPPSDESGLAARRQRRHKWRIESQEESHDLIQ